MKKVLALLLVLTLALGVVGCTESADDDTSTENESVNNAAEESESESDSAEESESVEESESESESEEAADESEEADVKGEGVMTYEEYAAAELDTEVVIEAYVQAKQSWWDDKATVYAQDKDGAYFLYNMACSAEDYEKLTDGTKIKVTGYKAEWSGEVEIVDATFEILEGNYVAEAFDVTDLLGTDELINHQNKFVSFKGMTVEAAGQDAEGNDVAYLYNWDGSGQDGNDLYFNVSLNGETYTFTIESYLCDNTTDVYAAVKELSIGDVIDMEGFLYWYEGANPHITSVTAAAEADAE